MLQFRSEIWFDNLLSLFLDIHLLIHLFVIQLRSLAEFWHWFVANVPGNSVGEGEEIFQLLHPLVLPEGNGGHRYKQKSIGHCFIS